MGQSPVDFVTRTAERIIKHVQACGDNKAALDVITELVTLELRLSYHQGFKDGMMAARWTSNGR